MKSLTIFLSLTILLTNAKRDANSRFKLCCARQKTADQTCKKRFCDFNVLGPDNVGFAYKTLLMKQFKVLLFLNLCSPKGNTLKDMWSCASSNTDHTECCKKK